MAAGVSCTILKFDNYSLLTFTTVTLNYINILRLYRL